MAKTNKVCQDQSPIEQFVQSSHTRPRLFQAMTFQANFQASNVYKLYSAIICRRWRILWLFLQETERNFAKMLK